MLTEFGKLCRKIRIDRNELLADMAEKVGVSSAFLSSVENGKRNVPKTLMETIRQQYSLSEPAYKEMQIAAERSIRQVKIEMEKMDSENRDLVLAFARNFEGLTKEKREKMMQLLK